MRKTTHRVIVGDSAHMGEVPDGTVDLVVTSPPYPMIEMWDDLFERLDPGIAEDLREGHADQAFARMHAVLDGTWGEVVRVLRPGGIACVNIGDAARSVASGFELFPNHVLVSQALRRRGLHALPGILWRKSTNKPTKFMGSGMLPGAAYVTLEHEHVLVLRKGGVRAFSRADQPRRRESAYFWEERNTWFSDVWTDLRGVRQPRAGARGRPRSAAFPLTFAYRLISMHSVLGDTVLDPFLGTGTTTLAAIAAGRSSIGYEVDPALQREAEARITREGPQLGALACDRLAAHRAFVGDAQKDGRVLTHRSRVYGFPVVTAQERELRFYVPDSFKTVGPGKIEVTYAPVKVPEKPQPP